MQVFILYDRIRWPVQTQSQCSTWSCSPTEQYSSLRVRHTHKSSLPECIYICVSAQASSVQASAYTGLFMGSWCSVVHTEPVASELRLGAPLQPHSQAFQSHSQATQKQGTSVQQSPLYMLGTLPSTMYPVAHAQLRQYKTIRERNQALLQQ